MKTSIQAARAERGLRLGARIVGTVFVLVALTFLVGDALVADDAQPPALSRPNTLGVVLLLAAFAGTILAWWRPIEGGLLVALAVALPIVQTFRAGDPSVLLMLVLVVGIAHVADGILRRRGSGPRAAARSRGRPLG